jgi:membrane-associated phospholipid phosphatase
MPTTFMRVAAFSAVLALSLTACDDSNSGLDPIPDAVQSSRADLTLDWNAVARSFVATKQTNVPASIRLFALLSVAQYDAIVTTATERQATTRASERGAIAGASATILSYIYSGDQMQFEAMLAEQRAEAAQPAEAQDFAAGESVGRRIANTLIARATSDRFFAAFTGTVPTCAGCWLAVPTPPGFATLGNAKPFVLTSTSQFRPAAPPAFGSTVFNAGLAEVRQFADMRTPAQDSIAKFWALPLGTVGAQGYLNEVATKLAVKHGKTERETAHLLALLNLAAFDGIIASHEAKFHYWLIRPSQADPGIVRAIGLPSFPAYPSNHSMLVGAAATILSDAFPTERAQLTAMATEGAISRLFGGIHYRFDCDAGLELGRKVAEWTLAKDPGQGVFEFR